MTRRTDRRAGGAVADPQRHASHVVAVVVPEPADAVPLVALEPPGAELAVVCLGPGTKEGRAALDRALAQAAERGCRVADGPRVLRTEGGDTVAALLDALREIGPERLRTLDPDPVHVSFDKVSGTPVHDGPAGHARAAADALAAARALQLETGEPVYVECHRAKADVRLGAASCLRYPLPVNWLSAGFDGRLTAFLPTAAGVVRRFQDAPDGRSWSGPELIEGPGLLPGLTVVRDPHGFPHLFGLRRTPRPDGGVDVAVVHAAQYRTGQPPTPWQPLGGPNAGDWRKGREVGFPTAAFDAAGNLFVFARNFGHSISCRRQSADGSWSPWQHLGGTRVADELVAVTTPYGGVEVLARARDTAGVVRWYADRDGAWTEDRTQPLAVRPGTMAPAPEPGGILFRDLESNRPYAWQPGAQAPSPLGDAEGSGPPAAVRGVETDGWTYSLLVGAGPRGTCALGVYPEGRPGPDAWWRDLGAPSYGVPAAEVSRTGRLTVATRAPGGRLLVAHRDERAASLAFDDWRTAGDRRLTM
ncbi:hypothetical protein [Streptomyces poonensis]|uniref:Uncharacterized protein n=1 Tax=Streptomyces poonensis TaxID=68255 RepID=A0A918PXC8_9ACTN|nr:hypothetical protein [Streptomyces poonensis]GGZ26116.1 hypothetical protein GCM10010365_53020 [Streptomyces poonensis]GLJ89034.1 hypothetical protein GCM10017589_16340 [Streptomyces poonensis]